VVGRVTAICVVFFSTAASAQEVPLARGRPVISPFGEAKARALMRDRLPCVGCHTLDGGGGRLGPDLSDVADRRDAEYVRRMIDDPQGTVPGSIMPSVPMASSTRELIMAFLTRRAAGPTRAREPRQRVTVAEKHQPARAEAREASALYRRYCAPCHGTHGQGDGPNATYLPVRPARHADPAFMSRRSDDRLFDAIYSGGYPLGRSVTMPAYGETLTRLEVWSLVRYLRELCRCSGPAWSADGDRSHTSSRPR
jgi:cytochrome c oxidase cbb3-type subunit 3